MSSNDHIWSDGSWYSLHCEQVATETGVRRCSSKWCSSATFLKRDSKHRCFPVNIAKFLRTSFFYGTLQVAAFVASIRLEIRFFSTFVASIRLEIRFFSIYREDCTAVFWPDFVEIFQLVNLTGSRNLQYLYPPYFETGSSLIIYIGN